MRAVALHPDVIVVTSAVLHVNCVLVRASGEPAECFVIDSPVLPQELETLGALAAQAGFPEPSGLLATHGDWDHLLGRLAFPGLALGCAESTAQRLQREPGAAQRQLREFDEELYIERPAPLSLGSVQGLPVPGRCELGAHELELHETGGHTADGMALLVDWTQVLIAGDYLSAIEIPMLNAGGSLDFYEATLERLRPLLARVRHVVSGHGPVLDAARARLLLDEDLAYICALREQGADAPLPVGRQGRHQREVHKLNVRLLG